MFLTKIPPLSLNFPPDVYSDRSLVRFHAMIQDVYSPEMYLSRIPGGRCGGWNLYQDLASSSSIDINFQDLRECSVFWAITVPGESRWYAKRLEGPLFDKVPRTPSRMPSRTRNRHKLPNPQSAGFGVLIKIYDNGLAQDLKPMATATFVGILTMESTEPGPEAVALPVLHVTHVQVPTPEILLEPPGNTAPVVYEGLINWVSQEALAGDRDAAELIILCSIARV